MTNIITQDWANRLVNWSEDDIQLAVVQHLRRRKIVFAADQNAGRRSMREGARRKALGMAAGEPDLRIYLPGGRLVLVELKKRNGKVSAAQKERHADLVSLGFAVHTLRADTPANAVGQMVDILSIYGVS